MSQNDFSIANQGFPAFRSDLNDALQALASNSSGSTAPGTTYAYQWWYDTSTNRLKMRNADNNAWVDFALFNQTNDTWQLLIGGTAVTASADELNKLDGVTATTTNLNATQVLPNRNIIINGSGRVNQRGYVSGTNTSGANQYTLDRWRVVTSGQNLSFTGDDSGRTMTAPAGGVEQVIEGANVQGGTYTLSYTGNATCTVGGVTRASGSSFSLTAGQDVTVRFSGGTFTNVQIEKGSFVTPFEFLPIQEEVNRCRRYWLSFDYRARWDASGSEADIRELPLPVRMRTTPSATILVQGESTNLSTSTIEGLSTSSFRASTISSTSGVVGWGVNVGFSAEF